MPALILIINTPYCLSCWGTIHHAYCLVGLLHQWRIIDNCTMSNNRIFGAGSRVEYQGRSANLAGTMVKRSPIFNHVSPQHSEPTSPFAHYNCKSQDTLHSDSQFSLAEQAQTFRAIAREESSRAQTEQQEQTRKMIQTMQAQIADFKEKFVQQQKMLKAQAQAPSKPTLTKEEVRSEAVKAAKEVETDIQAKLRAFFQKVNVELKNDILKTAEEEFVSYNYAEDLETRIAQIQQLIATVDARTRKGGSDDDSEVSLAALESLQPRFAKIEKTIETHRKALSEHEKRMEQIDEWIGSRNYVEKIQKVEATIEQLKAKILVSQQQSVGIRQRVTALQISAVNSHKNHEILEEQVKRVNLDLKTLEDRLTQPVIMKKKSSDERVRFDNSSSSGTSLTLTKSGLNSGATVLYSDVKTVVIDASPEDQPTPFKREEVAKSVEIEDFPNVRNSLEDTVKSANSDESRKSVYQVDSQGFLMDGEGNYLLNDSGQEIQLESSQISALLQSEDIQIIDN